jgi:histidinol phosphatase-like PHP family hydrolase
MGTEELTQKEVLEYFEKLNIPLFDLHTHSLFNYTQHFIPTYTEELGKKGPYLNVLSKAREFGIDIFGFSDHSYDLFKYSNLNKNTFLSRKGFNSLIEYIEFGKCVKGRYKNIIKVRCGIELYLYDEVAIKELPLQHLNKLDYIIIECHDLNTNLYLLRSLFPKKPLIYAHPNLELFYDNILLLKQWVKELVKYDVAFELSRPHLPKFIEQEVFFKRFFSIAQETGLRFSIGSDFHCRTQIKGYLEMYKMLINVIDMYELNNDQYFIKLHKE